MLSYDQKLLLANFVKEHKAVMIGRLSSTVTNTDRNKCWQEATDLLIANGAVTDAFKLRHNDWGNLTRSSAEKYKKSKQTGQKGSKLTNLDDVVLDVIGRETANMNAIGTPDMTVKVLFWKKYELPIF